MLCLCVLSYSVAETSDTVDLENLLLGRNYKQGAICFPVQRLTLNKGHLCGEQTGYDSVSRMLDWSGVLDPGKGEPPQMQEMNCDVPDRQERKL